MTTVAKRRISAGACSVSRGVPQAPHRRKRSGISAPQVEHVTPMALSLAAGTADARAARRGPTYDARMPSPSGVDPLVSEALRACRLFAGLDETRAWRSWPAPCAPGGSAAAR